MNVSDTHTLNEKNNRCAECGQRWPCDTADYLDCLERLNSIAQRHEPIPLYIEPCDHDVEDPDDRECGCIYIPQDWDWMDEWFKPDKFDLVCPTCRDESGDELPAPCQDYKDATGRRGES